MPSSHSVPPAAVLRYGELVRIGHVQGMNPFNGGRNSPTFVGLVVCEEGVDMIRRKRSVLIFLLVVALMLVALAGCTQAEDQGDANNGGTNGDADAPQSMTLELVEQWAESRHAQVVTNAATEEGCMNCHDGLTFTTTGGGFQARMSASGTDTAGQADANDPGTDEGGEESARDFTVATDCRACHMGAGAEIADKGSVDQIPSIPTAEGGLGSVCMACHNGWHASGKNASGALTAPHTSVQTDMLYGVNTVDPGVESNANAPDPGSVHLRVEDTCVGCHVTGAEGANHTFRVTSFTACESTDCHDQDMTDGGTATEDFDGDGSVEKTVIEIEGLTEKLKGAIEAKAGTFQSSRGQVAFAAGTVVDDATYAAAYNYFFVLKDGSRGIHNPAFTVDLLNLSIRAVGGATP